MRGSYLLVASVLYAGVAHAQGLSGTGVDCVLQGKAPEIKVCFKFAPEGPVEVRFWHEPKAGGPGGLYRVKMGPVAGNNCYAAVVPPPSTSTGVTQYTFQLKQPGQTLHTGQSITPKVVSSAAECGGKLADTANTAPECGPGLPCDAVHLEPSAGIQHIDPVSQAPLAQAPSAPPRRPHRR